MPTATLYDAEEYRRRKALRDCGSRSRRREFLWIDPRSGMTVVAVFRPAQSAMTPAHAFRRTG
jgi:hypothetical protein